MRRAEVRGVTPICLALLANCRVISLEDGTGTGLHKCGEDVGCGDDTFSPVLSPARADDNCKLEVNRSIM